MTHVYFATELEGVATFWRIYRKDGLTLGFTGHDHDLWLDGIRHRASPGMVPSSIRKTADLSADSAEVEGALSHANISAEDLAIGRFDGARIEIGAVDWETLHATIFYSGTIGSVGQEAGQFTAELRSAKTILDIDPIPRTSPTCRAEFCGPGCTLSATAYSSETRVIDSEPSENTVRFDLAVAEVYAHGRIRWIDGPLIGMTSRILSENSGTITIDSAVDAPFPIGTRAIIRQGCDHTLATCQARFANAINFQGEPFLPGNDLLSQYPSAR